MCACAMSPASRPGGSGNYDLTFNDRLTQSASDRVVNTADVSLLFQTVGHVELSIRRLSAGPLKPLRAARR